VTEANNPIFKGICMGLDVIPTNDTFSIPKSQPAPSCWCRPADQHVKVKLLLQVGTNFAADQSVIITMEMYVNPQDEKGISLEARGWLATLFKTGLICARY
jgi:hypothetical protein